MSVKTTQKEKGEYAKSTLRISEAVFEKHDYMKSVKSKVSHLDDFDPRPAIFRGSASSRLPELLHNKVKGEQLCISLLLDPHYQEQTSQTSQQPSSSSLPHAKSLKASMSAFKKTLQVTAERSREIEKQTCGPVQLFSVVFSTKVLNICIMFQRNPFVLT